MAKHLMLISLLALMTSCHLVRAFHSAPLQDFCVADLTGTTKMNGKACKDAKDANAEDFFYSGLHMPANTSNPFGYKSTLLTVEQLPGINTLGISMGRLDFAAYGVNPPHFHPRATEILTVLEGSLEVGFITSNTENRHFFKTLQKGDVFVFPMGLIHYQRNVNNNSAVAIVGMSSQNPGVVGIPGSVFACKPLINNDILAQSFHVDSGLVDKFQAKP